MTAGHPAAGSQHQPRPPRPVDIEADRDGNPRRREEGHLQGQRRCQARQRQPQERLTGRHLCRGEAGRTARTKTRCHRPRCQGQRHHRHREARRSPATGPRSTSQTNKLVVGGNGEARAGHDRAAPAMNCSADLKTNKMRDDGRPREGQLPSEVTALGKIKAIGWISHWRVMKNVVTDRQARQVGAPAGTDSADGCQRAASGARAQGLVVEGLSKTYKRRPVVRDVSLSVRRGEAVGLLGPNGAGKTTVFYMITGLIAADRARSVSTGRISPTCPCIGGQGWASDICRRRARSSADSRSRKTFAPCSS